MSMIDTRIKSLEEQIEALRKRKIYTDAFEELLISMGHKPERAACADLQVTLDKVEMRTALLRDLATHGYRQVAAPYKYGLARIDYKLATEFKPDEKIELSTIALNVRCERVVVGQGMQPVYKKNCVVVEDKLIEESTGGF